VLERKLGILQNVFSHSVTMRENVACCGRMWSKNCRKRRLPRSNERDTRNAGRERSAHSGAGSIYAWYRGACFTTEHTCWVQMSAMNLLGNLGLPGRLAVLLLAFNEWAFVRFSSTALGYSLGILLVFAGVMGVTGLSQRLLSADLSATKAVSARLPCWECESQKMPVLWGRNAHL
jgi:hypothetical protein